MTGGSGGSDQLGKILDVAGLSMDIWNTK